MSLYLKTDLQDTICALATAGGVGAIAIVRISGNNAIKIVDEIFEGKKLSNQHTHTVHFGKLLDEGIIIDEVLATIFISPKSYTGENTIELSCHGSPYIQQKILQLLVKKGARLAKPGEFTLRAFLNKKLDLSQAEAVADLIASHSESSHQTAMQQMRGNFSLQIAMLREKLVNFASLIELELDFGEEDVEFAKREDLQNTVKEILAVVSNLAQSFKYGNAIKNGIPTVIVGKPNAGKSTLLNAMVKEERAIVSDIAGTTRDTIEEAFVIDGITFKLIDTAGIRINSTDTIEKIGIERTFEKINQANIIIYLFDASTTSNDELIHELTQFEHAKATTIAVANKVDLIDKNSFDLSLHKDIIFLSLLYKTGIENLTKRLIDIVNSSKTDNNVVVSNIRHYEALLLTAESLTSLLQSMDMQQSGELLAFDIRKAIYHLGEIVGEITTDDLLTNIFSKFCIGK